MFPVHMNNGIKIILYNVYIVYIYKIEILFIFIFFLNWSIIYWWLQQIFVIYLWFSFIKKIVFDKKLFRAKTSKKYWQGNIDIGLKSKKLR